MALTVASQLDPEFNDQLRALVPALTIEDLSGDEPWRAAREVDAMLVVPSPSWRIAQSLDRPAAWPGSLRWVYSISAGVDGYPGWLLDAPLVSCGRGIASSTIADYVVAAIYRRGVDLDGVQVRSPAAWHGALRALGRIAGTTIGVVGLGSIGVEVARRGLALGAKVVAVRRRRLLSPVSGVELLDDLAKLFERSDHIVLALPNTEQSRGLVDAATLRHAKPTAHLINVARGSVVDQHALMAALDGGRLAYATLDVTDPMPLPPAHRLWTHPKVHLTPHLAAHSAAAWDNLFEKVAANLDRFARGRTPTDLVDRVAGY